MELSTQQEEYWKEDFIDYSIHLLIKEPENIHDAIFCYGSITGHLSQPIICGPGYLFQSHNEYFYFIALMQEKLNELKSYIDDTDI